MYIYHNQNPIGANVGDCVIRAISLALGQTWDDTYIDIAVIGYQYKNMPSSNYIWGAYLKEKGFQKRIIPDTCPNCYTVREFCKDHPYGTYILATGSHVVAAINGDYMDTWDSGNEVPTYYFVKDERQ